MTWRTISFIPTDKRTTRSVTACAKSLTHEWGCLCWCCPKRHHCLHQPCHSPKHFPMLLLKMLILPRRFEELVLFVAHAACELCLQIHHHLLHLLGMRTLELLQVIPRRGMNSFHMNLPSLFMTMPLNKQFAQLDLFRGMIPACPLSTLRAWRPSRICNAILLP